MIPEAAGVFAYDEDTHTYTVDGEVRPHVTGMLERAGESDSTWMTADSRIRGRAVHRMTADVDLGALDPRTFGHIYKGFLLAHVKAISIMRPQWIAIEEARLHPRFRYGCRTDRVMRYMGVGAVLEIKSGEPTKAHEIQTALQAIVEADRFQVPPEMVARFCLYLKVNGQFKLEEHTRRRDFDKAYKIIREQCY